MGDVPVYLEIGSKRVFAAALDWPGWCRAGRAEPDALGRLVAYGSRYARAVSCTCRGFEAPGDVGALRVVERLDGDSTTDFGAPGKIPARDTTAIGADEIERLQRLLRACWRTFDLVSGTYAGAVLEKGPRGGGRDLDKIRAHVLGAEVSYLAKLGGTSEGASGAAEPVRNAFLEALAASARGEIAAEGARGGKRWPAPYAARRAAWHVLDHAWEIEDRAG